MEQISLFLQKVGTFLADRRLWIVGLVLALLGVTSFFGVPAEAQHAVSEAFGETYGAAQGLVVAVITLSIALGKLYAAVVVVAKLIESWTLRAPSGLGFKEIAAPKG